MISRKQLIKSAKNKRKINKLIIPLNKHLFISIFGNSCYDILYGEVLMKGDFCG